MSAHTMGPFVGSDSLGFHSDCSCGARVAGATRDELRRAHQRHAGAGATGPGLAKARAALAESLERGKPVPEPAEVTR